MNNHADHRAADEKDQERDRLERLIPAEKTFRFGYKPATSDSTDFSDQFEKMKSNICRGSKSKVEEPLPDTTSSLAWLHRLGYYGLALLLVMIGVLVRMLLTRLVGPGLPTYITFYPLVMLAALVGGWGPGLLATVATAVVADYWLLPPPGLFKVESSVDLVGLVFFCTMSVLGSVVAELYRRIRNRLEDLICLRTVAVSQANDQLQLQAEELQTQTEELAAANAALQQSEEKFKAIFYRAALGLAITDPTGHILDCNLVCQQIFDYTKGELLQKRFLDLTHPDDIRKDSDLQRQVNDGSLDSYQLEKRCLRRDGQVIWCNVIASAIRNPDGRCDFPQPAVDCIHRPVGSRTTRLRLDGSGASGRPRPLKDSMGRGCCQRNVIRY